MGEVMRRVAMVCGTTALLLAGCDTTEPGAAVYFRTSALTEQQADSLELAISEAPFRVKHVAMKRIPGESARGEIRLVRGTDDSAHVEGLISWLRGQPQIVVAGKDSTAVLQ